MQLIRRFEEKAAEMYALGKIGGFLHLYIGQEAVAVGAMSTLRPDDYAIAGYREHGHILAKGGDPRRIMAELFGRRDGVSKGKGGSMHMFDRSINFLGGHAIVGGYLPIATGVGFAIRYEDRDRVILCFFGDGSVPQGEFHESMNLASLWKLPVVFICENNRYAMGTAIQRALAQTDISKYAEAYAMPGEACDGMDVLAVRECVGRAVARARESKAPTLVEARTYRFRGPLHAGSRRGRVPHEGRGRGGEASRSDRRPARAAPRGGGARRGRLAGAGRAGGGAGQRRGGVCRGLTGAAGGVADRGRLRVRRGRDRGARRGRQAWR